MSVLRWYRFTRVVQVEVDDFPEPRTPEADAEVEERENQDMDKAIQAFEDVVGHKTVQFFDVEEAL